LLLLLYGAPTAILGASGTSEKRNFDALDALDC